MPNWVIYTENLEEAIKDLEAVSPERFTQDGYFTAMLAPVGLIVENNEALALVKSDSDESDIELNAVLALGNLRVIGAFHPETEDFLPVAEGDEEILNALWPSTFSCEVNGKLVEVDLPRMFTRFT